MRTLHDRSTSFLQVLFDAAARQLEVGAAFEQVKLRAMLSHAKAEHRSDIRQIHLRSANAKTARLRRNVGCEPSAVAESFLRRDHLEFGWTFDNDAGAAVEDDLHQTGFEPQPSRL